jgi:type IV pilus assembly protein PilW
MLLISDNAASPDCVLEQVNAGFVGSAAALLPFNTIPALGTFYTPTGQSTALSGFAPSNEALATQIGHATANPPQLQMFAVGANATLQSFDLLRSDTEGLVPLADGLIEMRAIYGIDTLGNRTRGGWADPGAGAFSAAALNTGTTAARTSLKLIVAVRLGLILRSSLRERDMIDQPRTVTLFAGLPGQRIRTFTDEEMHYRYRTVEMTIPLRNMLYEP